MRAKSYLVALSILPMQMGQPCGGVSSGPPVRFLNQSNIIVWDKDRGIEHFIRQASFATKATDFGFLAPTPTVPEIAEADVEAYTLLYRYGPQPRATAPVSGGGFGGGSGGVQVMQEVKVGSYQATTLAASDARALTEWLRKNEFRTSPQMEQWTRLYIYRKWYLTAFKFVGTSEAKRTEAIRMSFRTLKPFNPYYVPKENLPFRNDPGLGLHIFFVSDRPHTPIGAPGGSVLKQNWEKVLNNDTRDRLMELLKVKEYPKGLMVQSFSDPKFPYANSTDDVIFEPSGKAPPRLITSLEVTIRNLYSETNLNN